MGVESEEPRVPQEGTGLYRVFKVITEGIAPISDVRAIAKETGLTTRQATIARTNLRLRGYLEKPTPELSTLTRHTQAATILPLVQEYRGLGLSPREIQIAVKLEKDKELSYESVHGTLVYNTRHGSLRSLSREEKTDILKDSRNLTLEEVSNNVFTILEFRKFLMDTNQAYPVNRIEWKKTAVEWRNNIQKVSTEDQIFAYRLNYLELVKEGEDASLSQQLEEIYKEKRGYFSFFPNELVCRLKAFLYLIRQAKINGDTKPRDKFLKLGLQIGEDWFYDQNSTAVKEQMFIADKIRNGKR